MISYNADVVWVFLAGFAAFVALVVLLVLWLGSGR
jgi:hypothetical protein